MKRSKTNKRQEIQPINLLEQEPLVPVTLEEFFPTGFFEKVAVNMTSCYETEEEGDVPPEESLEHEKRVLTILEALPACTGDKSSTYQKNYVSKLLLPCSTQSSMLTKSNC